VKAEVDYPRRYAVLVNTPAETDFARQVGVELVGAERCVMQHEPVTGSEDFAFMLQKVPGCYLLIGNGDGNQPGATMCHHPGYNFNDANLPVGSAYWVLLAQRFLRD
jgi:hippurate hydrolase